jgi:sulfate/thiosulfate transport system permease protein
VPLQIVIKLDEFQTPQATAIGVVLLFVSLLVLLSINGIEFWTRHRQRAIA